VLRSLRRFFFLQQNGGGRRWGSEYVTLRNTLSAFGESTWGPSCNAMAGRRDSQFGLEANELDFSGASAQGRQVKTEAVPLVVPSGGGDTATPPAPGSRGCPRICRTKVASSDGGMKEMDADAYCASCLQTVRDTFQSCTSGLKNSACGTYATRLLRHYRGTENMYNAKIPPGYLHEHRFQRCVETANVSEHTSWRTIN
jgi:hypothetical protein